MDNKKINWSREETILAFELYCTIPEGKDTVYNEQIIALASVINRSVNSVKLKLQNFKSYDPSYMSDGRIGLSHGSKLDKKICTEFLNSWDALVEETAEIKNRFGMLQNEPEEKYTELEMPIGTDKIRVQKNRIGQAFFRRAVLSSYNGKCCITGINNPVLLRASHIKPWSKSNDINEKTNPQNGVLLNALHDAAFDKGLLTISLDYKIVISSKLMDIDDGNKLFFYNYNGKEINKPIRFLPSKEFIEYHNDVVFMR